MRLARGTKVFFDTKMNLHVTACEPASPSQCEIRRLRKLEHAEHADVEGAGALLLAARHRELHVIDRRERTVTHDSRSTEDKRRKDKRTHRSLLRPQHRRM